MIETQDPLKEIFSRFIKSQEARDFKEKQSSLVTRGIVIRRMITEGASHEEIELEWSKDPWSY